MRARLSATDTVNVRRAGKDPVKMLYRHSWRFPLGSMKRRLHTASATDCAYRAQRQLDYVDSLHCAQLIHRSYI